MKPPILLVGMVLLLSWSSCSTGTDSPGTRGSSTDENTNQSSLDDYKRQLQGEWKRQSYPYGTIEFSGSRVKFVSGEGAPEPPQFKSFDIALECPDSDGASAAYSFDIALTTGSGNCDRIDLSKDALTIYFAGSSSGVVYYREGTDGDSKVGNDATDRILPLEPGFYVLAGTDCADPANAAWRYWTGEGLNGSTTKACTMQLKRREGDTFTVEQRCTDTYDQSQSTTMMTLRIESVNRFVLVDDKGDRQFELCENAPSWLTQ